MYSSEKRGRPRGGMVALITTLFMVFLTVDIFWQNLRHLTWIPYPTLTPPSTITLPSAILRMKIDEASFYHDHSIYIKENSKRSQRYKSKKIVRTTISPKYDFLA